MSGADVLAQVREALNLPLSPNYDRDPFAARMDNAIAALDGCVLLTREEARRIEDALDEFDPDSTEWRVAEARALLTPTKEEA